MGILETMVAKVLIGYTACQRWPWRELLLVCQSLIAIHMVVNTPVRARLTASVSMNSPSLAILLLTMGS